MSDPSPNWSGIAAIITMGVVAVTAVVSALKWLFSRPSLELMTRMHEENRGILTTLSDRLAAIETPIKRIEDRVERAERDILNLREWNHTKGNPYIGAVDILKARLDALESQ